MTISINVGGVWKEVDTPKINVGGTWKTPDKVSINVSGVWKQVWPEPIPPVLTLNNIASSDTDSSPPYSSQVGIRVLTNGDFEKLQSDSSWAAQASGTEWTDDGGAAADEYEVMLEKTSGDLTLSDGPALDLYHTINATRQWTITSLVEGEFDWVGNLYIREIANPSNIVSCIVSFTILNGTA